MLILFALSLPRLIARENEGDDDGAPDDDGSPEVKPPVKGGTFTQEQVNDIVVKRNKKVREQLESVERNYEKLLQSTTLSQQEKAELQGELDSVQTQLRTKEQQAAHESRKQQTEYTKKLEESVGQRDYYKNLFESTTRDREIVAAAAEHGAFSPEQFIMVLGNKAKVVEELDGNGERTGRMITKVEMEVKGDDGLPVRVLKTPGEAIEEMKNDISKYGNLFRSNVAKGIGDGSNNKVVGGTRVDQSKISDEEYFANREQYRQQLGLRKPRSF